MNRYMVEVALSGINPNEFEVLVAKEQEVVAELSKTGFIEQIYICSDLSGAYLVVREHDESRVKEQFTSFPMFPYMTLKIIRIQN